VFQQGGYISNAVPLPQAGSQPAVMPAAGPARWELGLAAYLRETDEDKDGMANEA